MLKINFYPDSDNSDFIEATKAYSEIWKKHGEKIVGTIEKISGLKFREKFINVIVYQGINQSSPLSLHLASDVPEHRRAVLVHELCHRLLTGNRDKLVLTGEFERQFGGEVEWSFRNHKIIDLILFEIWADLFGKEFANKSVERESNSDGSKLYKEAWDWALSMTKEDRHNKFKKLTSGPVSSV